MTLIHKAEASFERGYPLLAGVAAAVICAVFGVDAFAYMDEQSWAVPAIYSQVFSLAALFTAFLLTFFVFFITTDRGFIGRAKATRPYKETVTFTIAAMRLGAALTLASFPMAVASPIPAAPDMTLLLVSLWSGLAIWTAAAFYRAASVFAIFAKEHI